jgi:hypothetical protein
VNKERGKISGQITDLRTGASDALELCGPVHDTADKTLRKASMLLAMSMNHFAVFLV